MLPESERSRAIPPRPELRELGPTLADRARLLWSDPRVRFAALAIAAVLAGVIWYRIGASGSSDQRASSATSHTVASSTTTVPADTAATSEVVVQVAGAVAHPGVVRLTKGSRVTDAIERAGGGVPGADLERLNLAAKLVDGERIAVPKLGERPVPAVGPGSDGDPAGTTPGTSSAGAPLNLNTATQAQLEALPGVGPTLAAAILAERDKRGGFTSVNDLRSVRGIGDRRFADLKDLVTV